MANQTPVAYTRAGVNITTAAAAADAGLTDTFVNTGAEFAVVINGSGAPITVTLQLNGTGAVVDGQTPTSRTVSVPANDTMAIGPFPPGLYNDVNNKVTIGYSAVTTVKILILKRGAADP